MRTQPYDIHRGSAFGRLRPFIPGAAGFAACAAIAAAFVDAGPGNWARLEPQVIVLPTLVVTGRREMPEAPAAPDLETESAAVPGAVQATFER